MAAKRKLRKSATKRKSSTKRRKKAAKKTQWCVVRGKGSGRKVSCHRLKRRANAAAKRVGGRVVKRK